MIRPNISEVKMLYKICRYCYNKYVAWVFIPKSYDQRIVLVNPCYMHLYRKFLKAYLTQIMISAIIIVTTEILERGGALVKNKDLDKKKLEILKKYGALNLRPERVKDTLFLEEEFFDPHDLMQTKYEMLRRVQKDGESVTQAASRFGFSRLSFYRI